MLKMFSRDQFSFFHLLFGNEAAFNVFFRYGVGKDEVLLIYDAVTCHPGTTLATLSLGHFPSLVMNGPQQPVNPKNKPAGVAERPINHFI